MRLLRRYRDIISVISIIHGAAVPLIGKWSQAVRQIADRSASCCSGRFFRSLFQGARALCGAERGHSHSGEGRLRPVPARYWYFRSSSCASSQMSYFIIVRSLYSPSGPEQSEPGVFIFYLEPFFNTFCRVKDRITVSYL